MLQRKPLKQVSDKRRKQLEEAGLPLNTFSFNTGKPLKAKTPLKNKSSKQSDKDKEYHRVCLQIDMNDLKEHGDIICRFCQQPVGDDLHHHHVAGRTGDLTTNPRNIWPAHASCHTEGENAYHNMPLSQQIKQAWFPRLLETMREVGMAKFRVTLGKAEEYGYKHIPPNED